MVQKADTVPTIQYATNSRFPAVNPEIGRFAIIAPEEARRSNSQAGLNHCLPAI